MKATKIYSQYLGKFSFPEITRLPFYDDFNRIDGGLKNGWIYNDSAWKIESNRARTILIPGDNLHPDPNADLETWLTVGSVITNERSIEQFYSSQYSRKFVRNTTTSGGCWPSSSTAIPANNFYLFRQFVYPTSQDCQLALGNSSTASSIASFVTRSLIPNQWQQLSCYGISASVRDSITSGPYAATGYFSNTPITVYVDDLEIRKLDFKHLMAVRNFGTSNIDITVQVMKCRGPRFGIVLCVDDINNPRNFITADVNQTTANINHSVRIYKYVDGVLTSLVNVGLEELDINTVRVVKNGSTVSIYNNGTLAGTPQTISDSSIVNNTYHGLFCAGDAGRILSFSAVGV